MQRVALVLAAATVTGFGIASANAAVNLPTTKPAPTHTAIVSSSKTVAPSADSKIDSLLANATDDALTPRHMDHLVSHFDQSSRNRLAESSTYKENYGKALDAQITRISEIWKTKYGHELSATRADHALGASFATLQIGTVGKDAKLASEIMADTGQSALMTPARAGMTSNESIALANVKSADGLSELHVALAAKSGGTWKILAPKSLTVEKLRSNLHAELAPLASANYKWPANEAEAYRDVAHRMLSAIENQPAPAQRHAAATNAPVGHQQQASAAPVRSAAKPASASGTGHWWQFWRW